MNEKQRFDELIAAIKLEFPKLKLIPKEDSLLMKVVFHITLMRFWCPKFMSNFITMMFGNIYMPANIFGTGVGYDIMLHELVHLRDKRKYPVLFELTYLFFPLPFVITGRAFWEYRAYCESLKAEYQRFGRVRKTSIEFYVNLFANSDYLWMFPFKTILRDRFYNYCSKNNFPLI